MENYKDQGYAHKRLVGTIIKIDGRAAFVDQIADKKVAYIELVTGARKVQDVNKMDITPVPLGYINMPQGFITYAMRTPKREDWRQGLRINNTLRLITHDEGGIELLRGQRLFPETVNKVDLGVTIEGIFPKFKDVVRNAYDKMRHSQAFDRHFGIIKKEKKILYKGELLVGELLDNKGTYRLFDDFQWVREELEEAIG